MYDDVFDELRRIRHRLRELHRDLHAAIFAAITHNTPLEGAAIMAALDNLKALGARIDAVTALLPTDIAAAVKAQADADAAAITAAQDALATAQAAAVQAETDLATEVSDLTTKVAALEKAAGVTITPMPIAVDVSGVPTSATVGSAYTGTVRASGGSGTYTFTATGLPDGVSLDSGGNLSGAPTTAGDSSVTFTATDGAGAQGTATVTITAA